MGLIRCPTLELSLCLVYMALNTTLSHFWCDFGVLLKLYVP